MVTIDEVRALALTLPRSYEAYVRGRVKFRVGHIVFASFAPDGSVMGFGFPKEWRDALIESEPEKFSLPSAHDLRSLGPRPPGGDRGGRDVRARRGRLGDVRAEARGGRLRGLAGPCRDRLTSRLTHAQAD